MIQQIWLGGFLLAILLGALLSLASAPILAAAPFVPNRTALIVIDIQNDYFPGGRFVLFASEEASLQAAKLLEAFRQKRLTVIHVRHENLDPTATFFLPGTAGIDIHPSVDPLPGEPVIVKNNVSSFANTNLAETLKAKNLDHLVICGMQTSVCVKGTALEAVMRFNYRVTVADGATAARDAETHRKALQEMAAKNIEIVSVEELLGKLG